MTGNERIKEILLYESINGIEKTKLKYGLKEETISRYKRFYRKAENPSGRPKVLLFDIETSPMVTYTWKLGKVYLSPDKVITDWYVICWSAKWLNEPDMFGDVLTDEEALLGDDSRIMKSIWEKIDEADIVIAHNGNNFDLPMLNTRWLLQGMNPPSPYQSIDTLKAIWKKFKFSSSKLDYVAQLTCNKQKLKTDFDLWKRCFNGNMEALEYMFEYNKKDVLLLEEVYMQIRPWIPAHPNMSLFVDTDKPVCTHCGSENIEFIDGYYATAAGLYRTFRCECGAIGRMKKREKTSDVRSLGR